MSRCKFEYNDERNLWVCSVCGRTVAAPKTHKVYANCYTEPSIVKKAVNYTKAVATHIITGSHTRTDEEVEKLLEICKTCDKFNLEKSYCTICGCRCNANKSAFTNKLRMKSQKCPKGKWK